MIDMSTHLPKVQVGLTLSPIAGAELLPRQDLTSRSFMNQKLDNKSLHQSLLNGSLFRDCVFFNVDFSRCDFESVRLEGCDFKNCSFETVQLRSCDIGNSKFSNCTFEGATIVDIRCRNSSFDSCSHEGSFSRDCHYENSTFSTCSLTKSNTILNTYSGCQFNEMKFGNCTFLLHVFQECEFHHCAINTDSVGQTFGITEQQIGGFQLIFLGETQQILEPKLLIKNIADEYINRSWILPYSFLCINFKLLKVGECAQYIGEFIRTQFSGEWPVKRDEAIFLVRILELLNEQNRLPLSVISDLYNEIQSSEPTNLSDANRSIYNFLLTELSALISKMLIQISNLVSSSVNLPLDQKILAQITLGSRPAASISQSLNLITEYSDYPTEYESTLKDSYDGSYIELIWTTVYALIGLQVALFCLEGVLIRITKLRARTEVMVGKKLPAAYRKEALATQDPIEPILMSTIRSIIKNGLDGSPLKNAIDDISNNEIREIRLDTKE